MRCASVSIGIVEYLDLAYTTSDMRLRYAIGDAEAFHQYVSLGWPADAAPEHELFRDSDATIGRIREHFAAISGGGHLDLFFLYLSGHGEVGPDGSGWFCLTDAEPGRPSLDGAEIDRWLNAVDAECVIVFIDCCHAEAVIVGSRFFAVRQDRRAHVVAASCRTDQRAWEDDGLKRSVFSDVLLRALSTDSPIAEPRGQVDVQARLLPYLRDQVPTAASALKRGQDQDPVTSGFMSGPLTLPVVSTKSLGRPLTIPQAIRAGVRRFLAASLIALAAVLIATDVLIFHIAVDGTGELIVRPGFRGTYAALPFHVVPTLDTGLSIRDFNARNSTNDKLLAALAAGSLWGFATHRDGHGVKTWFEPLEPGLLPSVRNRLDALAFGEASAFDVDSDSPVVTETLFLSSLKGKRASEIGRVTYPLDLHITWACTEPIANRLDFTRLLENSDVFRRDMQWAAVTTPAEPAARAAEVTDLVKLAAYRAFHKQDCEECLARAADSGVSQDGSGSDVDPDERRLIEFDAFAAAIESIVGDHPTDTFRSEITPFLKTTKGTWCSVHGAFAQAMTGSMRTSSEAEASLFAIVESYDRSKQGDTGGDPQQQMAVRSLELLARRRPLDPITLDKLSKIIARDAADLTPPIPAMTLLKGLVVSRALTSDLKSLLFRNLRPERGPGDFTDLAAANMLARNYSFLNSEEKTRVRQWLADAASANAFVSDFHEALGFVSLVEQLPEKELALLETRLSSMSRFPPQATNYRGEMVITSTGDSAAVALGRVAQTHILRPDVVERLANIAVARADMGHREEIIRGLARQWYGATQDFANHIRERLNTCRGDATRRALEVDVAGSALENLPASQKNELVNHLIVMWSREPDPAQRVALAKIVGSAGQRLD